MRCFRAKGYDEISVNDICREADIARSTFYRVFSNKKDVIRYLFEHTDANSIVSIEELLAARNDFDRMWIIGDRYISLCKELGVPFITTLLDAHCGSVTLLKHGEETEPLIGVYDKDLAPLCAEILQTENTKVRQLIRQASLTTVAFTGDPLLLINCNTPAEYEAILRAAKSG